MFLAMDTVFDQCSVAILDADGEVITIDTESGKRQQTQQILPMIDAALTRSNLKLADLQALIFNRGPGAFSGIRINTAVVQALSVAHDLPCVGISSLQAIAQKAYLQYGLTEVYSALDARMQQVYFGHYALQTLNKDPIMQPVLTHNAQSVNNANIDNNESDEDETSTERLLDYERQTDLAIPIVGDGAALLSLNDAQEIYAEVWPDASIIGQLGIAQFALFGGTEAELALPKYLRHQAWKTLKEQGKA